MNVETLTDLYRHMEWADAAVWAAVLASEGGRADAQLRGQLYHLHVVQRAFLRLWLDEPREAPYPTFDDAESLMRWGRGYYGDAFARFAALGDGEVSEPRPVPWAEAVGRRLGRSPGLTTLGETALQVALHSTYHRGQINSRLREVGGEPPLVDYIAWVWLGRPSPDWPHANPPIFHITTRSEADEALRAGSYVPGAFQQDGFIHCSYSRQLTRVANERFRGRTDLVLLRIDRAGVGCEVVDENLEGGPDLFPHIYGPLPMSAVTATIDFPSRPDGTFDLPAGLTA